jgi:hypothetical protein
MFIEMNNYQQYFSFGFAELTSFGSFAPPKEMKQRKGVPKCQPQPKRAPATQAFMRYRFGYGSHHFGFCQRTTV